MAVSGATAALTVGPATGAAAWIDPGQGLRAGALQALAAGPGQALQVRAASARAGAGARVAVVVAGRAA